MGYLSDLTSTLIAQLNATTTNRERTAIVAQLATVQRASGSQATVTAMGYLVDLKASIETRLDSQLCPTAERQSLIEQLALVQAAMGGSGGGSGGGSSAGSIGDLKFGIQTSDHSGWYLCDNRLVTTLPTTVQARYVTDLGIATGRLPNAPTGTTLTVGSRTASVGSSSITQANLPNVNLSASSVSAGTPSGTVSLQTHSATSGGFDPNPTTGVNNLQQTDRTPDAAQTLGSTIGGGFSGSALPTHSHSVSLGGSGTAYIPASVGGNMFIYLGL